MDDKLIDELLKEDVPDWDYEDCITAKNISNVNADDMSLFSENDEEIEPFKVYQSLSNGGLLMSSGNEIFEVNSNTDASTMSLKSQRRYYNLKHEDNKVDTCYSRILHHRTGQIIKHAILTKVANQMSSIKSKTNFGYFTCCTRGKFLAIGTSKGITCLFDVKQVLKFYMEEEGPAYGAVSSLSFNTTSTRLLVGFVKAHITMWDISDNEGKLLRSINVNQGPGYAVSFVSFLTDPTMAVYADTNGSVFQLIFKRGIGGRSTDLECFFSGSRGEILCLESLYVPKHIKKHELDKYSLLAMASFTKVIIISCKPQLKVKFMHLLKGKPDTLPHLQWAYNIQINDDLFIPNGKEAFLTFARDSDIYVLKVSTTFKTISDASLENGQDSDLKFEIIYHMSLEFQILSIKWMNQYIIGVIDFDEQFHAIDIQTKQIVESLNMKSAQIIYNTSLFKSIATGGNVSEAMSAAAERACYHSVVEKNCQIKILGQQEMHVIMLRPWMEAIDLVRKNRGPENAFKMCSELYKGNNLICRQVLLLQYRNEDRQKAVTKYALNLIENVLNSVPMNTDYNHFIKSMVNLCIEIHQIDFFTNKVFDKLSNNSDLQIAFIHNVLELILNNVVNTLHPELVQKIVHYLQSTDQFAQLDSCIAKLNISCIDLDHITKLCTKHFLFSSFIHIYNSAFNDFLTPIKHMIDFIADPYFTNCDHETQSETVIKAIVYIHCCFAGKDFFSGNELPDDISDVVKMSIFEYLVPFSAEDNKNSKSLPILLKYNSSEFLNMITLALDETFFITDLGISRKQMILQRLCDYFISDKTSYSKTEIMTFFVFLFRELNKPSSVSIYMDQVVLDELIEQVFLGVIDDNHPTVEETSPSTKHFLHNQAETAFLNVLHNNITYRDYWLKSERILTLSRKAHFYRICEFIYRQKKMLHMVLECFLFDPEYRYESFQLIESIWYDENVEEQQKSQIFDKCFQLAEHLVTANSTLSVIVLLTACNKSVEEIILRLGGFKASNESQNRHIFNFLKSFFLIRNEIEIKDSVHAEQITLSKEVSNTIKSYKVQNHVAELFIDLLCKFDPDILQLFLNNSIDYRNDNAINIISKYHLPYSLSFLYEKSKKFELASNLYLKIFDDLWTQCLDDSDFQMDSCIISLVFGESFQHCLDRFINLVKKCKANNFESYWTRMLTSVLQKQVTYRKDPYASLIEVIFTYFVKMLSQEISMPLIMVTILKSPVFTGEKFGKVRELVLAMMNSFNFEEILLLSSISLMDEDISNCLTQLKEVMGQGVMVCNSLCSICHKSFICLSSQNNKGNIFSFRCGHRMHEECIRSMENSENEQQNICSEFFCTVCKISEIKKDYSGLKPITNILEECQIPNYNTDCTNTGHTSLNGNSFIRNEKDITSKLRLAPPNYLLNFCSSK